ncbi:UPF0149 family protein [Vibrio viridaestus]|uniref:YecA family protein n=1 Tax=Vibrio viridaestus TaxID=2487322 RepID=A0A3N9TH08_9VIBR|nr:UPF0149 family protein [Vibrio viridaestus]RQW63300.1 YecA family protein [Vibrio viridaestus]
MTLSEFITTTHNEESVLNEAKTHGFLTALAVAPNLLPPTEWLPYLWGGTEQAPFTDGEMLEQYIDIIVAMWNGHRSAVLDGSWNWPEGFVLDEDEIVSVPVRDLCEGILQGWQLTADDWNVIMPEETEDGALLGGFLLSISMLFDPDTAMTTLTEHGIEGLDQFEEIYDAVPQMLVGLAKKGEQAE